jgi:hypothetical protein
VIDFVIQENQYYYIDFHVFAAFVVQIMVVCWFMTLCNTCLFRRFVGMFCLRLQVGAEFSGKKDCTIYIYIFIYIYRERERERGWLEEILANQSHRKGKWKQGL